MADVEQTEAAGEGREGKGSLKELALFFLRLGTTAFGGPAAHIAIMEDELVRRRKWLTREKFLDLLGASSLIPGPSSSELAIHIGYLRAGGAGLVVGGICFIMPAAILVAFIAWAYVRYGHLPAVAGVLYGVKPVVIAAILQALWGLGRTAVKSRRLRSRAYRVGLEFFGDECSGDTSWAGRPRSRFHATSNGIAEKPRCAVAFVLLWREFRPNLAPSLPLAGAAGGGGDRARVSGRVPGVLELVGSVRQRLRPARSPARRLGGASCVG